MDVFSSYIESLPMSAKPRVQQVLLLADQQLPGAERVISYQMPTYRLHGKNVFHVAGYEKHIGIYPGPTVLQELVEELKSYKVSKGTWQIQHHEELPTDLLIRLLTIIQSRSL